MTSGIWSLGRPGRRHIWALTLGVFATLASPPAAEADDLVLKWNEIAVLRTSLSTNPVNQTRIMAATQLAVFEAANAITGEYESYLEPAIVAPAGASLDAAIVSAAHRMLTAYFGGPVAVAALNAARDLDLGAMPDGPSKDDGIAVGLAAANAMLALRVGDGSSPLTISTPAPGGPGEYQLTALCTAALFYNWQNVRPFAIPDITAYLLPPPPALTDNLYTKDYDEVKVMGAAGSLDRPADRAEVAILYGSLSPTWVVNTAARQIVASKGLSPSESARSLALVTMGVADSLIATFYNKYQHNFWRPSTGIRNGSTDGNDATEGDPGFLTFLLTPCFPSYPSNHGSATSGGLEVMRRLFGAAAHDITLTVTIPAQGSQPALVITRHYAQLHAIADDVADARVYAGIHWRFDQVAADVLGRAVGTEVVKTHLRPVHP
jgi:hypothetical protein